MVGSPGRTELAGDPVAAKLELVVAGVLAPPDDGDVAAPEVLSAPCELSDVLVPDPDGADCVVGV